MAAAPVCVAPSAGAYSVRGHFGPGCAVLLSGATGYVGSLVLEKLLRSTDVGRVYVLLRARRGAGPGERLERLLCGPLFHLIDARRAARVTAVAGDLLAPGLGLSASDEARLVAEVDTLIHCAADIRLEAHIHQTLRANLLGSRMVVELAARMPRLRSVAYVATCYVNINRPLGTRVEERQYPLCLGGKEVDVGGIAEELLSLEPDEAAARATSYIRLWGFRNTYALGKHLAEKEVASLQRRHGLPLVVVRPSLVSAVSAEPYCGFAGNYAGQVGAGAAYLLGLYDDQPEAAAMGGSSVWDVVPGDVVAHAVIAAAAAAAVPAARRLIAETRAVGTAAAPEGTPAVPADTVDGRPPLMIVQVGTSCTYPLTASMMFNQGVAWCAAHPRPFTLALGKARPMDPGQRYDEALWRRHMRTAARRVNAAAWVMGHLGSERLKAAEKLMRVGLRTYETINTPKYDLQLYFSADNLLALEAAMDPGERDDFCIVWRPPAPKPAALRDASGPEPPAAAPVEGFPAPPPRARVLAGCGCLMPQVSDAAPGAPPDEPPADAADPVACVVVGAPRAGAKAGAPPAGGGGPDCADARARERARAAREGGWVLFHHNVLAYLYRELYCRDVPRDAAVPRGTLRALVPVMCAEQRAAGGRVRHMFEPVKGREGGRA